MDKKLETLSKWIDESSRIVFFTGAGASTESGIPDFRSVDGLYHQSYDFPPEEIISHHFFVQNPKEFYRFYRSRMIYPEATFNAGHEFMALLESMGKCSGIVTQNIDHLHTMAGSKNIAELHGSIMRNACTVCHQEATLDQIMNSSDDLPRCSKCGGLLKPDVVLYEEPLKDQVIHHAVDLISQADCLIICGTSLTVYPAASLIQYFRGKHLVVINKTTTPMDEKADCCIQAPLGQTLKQAHQLLGYPTSLHQK